MHHFQAESNRSATRVLCSLPRSYRRPRCTDSRITAGAYLRIKQSCAVRHTLTLSVVGRIGVLQYHEWWRLGTSAFLHANATHLYFQELALLYLRRFVRL